VDRHRFDADLDPDLTSNLMLIWIRSGSDFYCDADPNLDPDSDSDPYAASSYVIPYTSQNQIFFYFLFTAVPYLSHQFVINFCILDRILKFSGKSIVYIWLKWIQILIGRPWMPIRIRLNDADTIRPIRTTTLDDTHPV